MMNLNFAVSLNKKFTDDLGPVVKGVSGNLVRPVGKSNV